MTKHTAKDDHAVVTQLRSALSGPAETVLTPSRTRVRKWFAAVNQRGLCALDFGRQESEFLQRFDSRARLEKDPKAVQRVLAQLREYFAGDRSSFNLPVDISQLTPFQRSVLDVACRIAPGQVWTYQRIAKELGRPRSSRPVGGALARNPIPIVIPCHRVIASDGSLGGYSGGSGLKAKRWLLRLEGAM
jgi:methylated-DNA-[protein]-cysteine S-methyltransferase